MFSLVFHWPRMSYSCIVSEYLENEESSGSTGFLNMPDLESQMNNEEKTSGKKINRAMGKKHPNSG